MLYNYIYIIHVHVYDGTTGVAYGDGLILDLKYLATGQHNVYLTESRMALYVVLFVCVGPDWLVSLSLPRD